MDTNINYLSNSEFGELSILIANNIERWIFDEILPSIREHGAYLTKETLFKIINNPNFTDVLIENLQNKNSVSKVLTSKNIDSKCDLDGCIDKLHYLDNILCNDELIPITVIAKDYGISAIKFNELLSSLKVQYKTNNTWFLYQAYSNNGYTSSKTIEIGDKKTVTHTYWTQKGRLFLYELLKKKLSLLPTIENNIKNLITK